jgi:hypothetical protein
VKMKIRNELGLSNESLWKHDGKVREQRRADNLDRAVPPAPPTQSARGNMNIEGIVCAKCAKTFMPSMNQKQKFAEQQIPLPDKCPKCLGQICDRFREDGQCPYGDGCKFLHPAGDAPTVPTDDPKKHSYSCRFFATGHCTCTCMSGDKCRFQHGPPIVHTISEADPSVYNMSEIESSDQDPKDESLAVEVYKGRFNDSGRFGCRAPDTSKYRYV